MRIVFANLWWDPAWATLADAADPWSGDRIRPPLAAALARRGHDVTLIQDAPADSRFEDRGVRWVGVAAEPSVVLRRRLAATARAHFPGAVAVPSRLLAVTTAALSGADILHGFDPTALRWTAALGTIARAAGVPLVAHHHGGAPRRGGRGGAREGAALSQIDALCFTTEGHADPFVAAGTLRPDQIRVVQEVSSEFAFSSDRAPDTNGPSSDSPVVVHIGRLDAVKGPLTMIEGFARFHVERPEATLQLAWTDAPLLPAIRSRVAALGLEDVVRFHGRLDRRRVEKLLQSADVLVQASLREVCGTAALEAMATGCIPVLSDIPSFRAILGDELSSGLFPVGDAGALALALRRVVPGADARPIARKQVRARFDAACSWDRVAEAVEGVYRAVRRST